MFKQIKVAVNHQLVEMSTNELFTVDIDKDTLWDTYLDSFPRGTNGIYRERRVYDCSCCKQFIKNIGNVVSVDSYGEIISVWDISTGIDKYDIVASAMSEKIKSCEISGIYRSKEPSVGNDYNMEEINGEPKRWEHFFHKLSNKFILPISKSIGDFNGDSLADRDVLKRGLEEMSIESIEIVEELIKQNSIYRGEEHTGSVSGFKVVKKEYESFENKNVFCWVKSAKLGRLSRFKNSVIGTLVSDISNGVDLEDAVRMFESKVAPQNYKRSSALITNGMIKKAEDKVKELGIENSLKRRYAITEDITVNNVIYADRVSKSVMDGSVFDDLKSETKDSVPDYDKVKEVTIDKFINDVVPTADSIEIMVDNNHTNNLVSIIAPVNSESRNILKWGNNFSWSYNGEVTDSIKERVKRAGGKVDGYLRFSLSWFNGDDLDIHAIEPCGNHISYNEKRGVNGFLDIDMNAGGVDSRDPVENIVFNEGMKDGVYRIVVNQFSKRESIDGGFEVEMEFNGKTTTFSYGKLVRNKESINVIEFQYSKKDGIKKIQSIDSASSSKRFWGVNTMKWSKVSMIMNSPNHWNGNQLGNKHTFFVIDGCKNPGKSRGLYNEFLINDLTEHRKVFEVLGSKIKAPESDNQLSGVGFSSTIENEVLCKVTGKTNRIIKIKF